MDDRRSFVRASVFGGYNYSRKAIEDRGEIGNMVVRQPHYSKEEFAQRGDRWYETQIRQKVEAGNHGKIVSRPG